MRGHMDAAEYKHVALGLIFLKYISDAFEERHQALLKEEGADPEDRDEYAGESIFWVPKQARWDFLQKNAKQVTIGKLIDGADLRPLGRPRLKSTLKQSARARREYNAPRFRSQEGNLGQVAI